MLDKQYFYLCSVYLSMVFNPFNGTDGIPIDENQPIDFSKTITMADIDGVPLEDVQNIDGQPLEEDTVEEPGKKLLNYLHLSIHA